MNMLHFSCHWNIATNIYFMIDPEKKLDGNNEVKRDLETQQAYR
jgi:hypothetical protein